MSTGLGIFVCIFYASVTGTKIALLEAAGQLQDLQGVTGQQHSVVKVPEKRWGMHDEGKRGADREVSQSASSRHGKGTPSSLERTRQRALMVSHELLTAFLPGKQLLIGLAHPYEFVAVSEAGSLGLRIPVCMCPEHDGSEGTHILKTSEVALVIEGGPDRVWVFISIPARLRGPYAWMPAVTIGPCVDAEVCGVLVANPT